LRSKVHPKFCFRGSQKLSLRVIETVWFIAGCGSSCPVGFFDRRQDFKPGVSIMPQGDKAKYTDKQKRKAEHIEEGYEKRGAPKKEAERRAWATVNKTSHGGKKPGGSGRGKTEDQSPSRKGGRIGGSSQSHATRVKAGKKAARTRARAS
jgi:hypothetical protein